MFPEIKIAYYQKKDWTKLLNIADDRETMHDTWEEWHREYNRIKTELRNQGIVVHEITIDLNELKIYCMSRNLKNDGKARSQYVQQLPLNKKEKS